MAGKEVPFMTTFKWDSITDLTTAYSSVHGLKNESPVENTGFKLLHRQQAELEKIFQRTIWLSRDEVYNLADRLLVPPTTIRAWFENRRSECTIVTAPKSNPPARAPNTASLAPSVPDPVNVRQAVANVTQERPVTKRICSHCQRYQPRLNILSNVENTFSTVLNAAINTPNNPGPDLQRSHQVLPSSSSQNTICNDNFEYNNLSLDYAEMTPPQQFDYAAFNPSPANCMRKKYIDLMWDEPNPELLKLSYSSEHSD